MRCRCNKIGVIESVDTMAQEKAPSSPPPSSSRPWVGSPPSSARQVIDYPAHPMGQQQEVAYPWGELARPYPLVHVDAMPSISEDEFDYCNGMECEDDDNQDKENSCYTIDPDIYPKGPHNGGFSHPWNDITPDSISFLSRPYKFHHVDAMLMTPTIVESTMESDET